jgi:hypothetical protein
MEYRTLTCRIDSILAQTTTRLDLEAVMQHSDMEDGKESHIIAPGIPSVLE